MKNCLFLTAILAIPALCSALVIGDFEGTDNLEGWEPAGAASTVNLSTSTFAATVGSRSLRIQNTSTGNTWGAIIKSVFGDADAMAAITTPGSTITMDVRATGQGVTGSFLNLRLLVNGDNGGDGANEQMNAQSVTINNTTQSMTFELTDTARAILANSSSRASIGFSSESDNARIWYVDNIQIIAPSSEGASLYAAWLESYPTLTNTDLQSNLYAYAIGADPTNPEATGHHPEGISVDDSGDMDYIYYQRNDAAARGLVYTVETTDSLEEGNWTAEGYTVESTEEFDEAFTSVTNRLLSTDPHGFFRLKVEAQFSHRELDDYGGLKSLAFDIPNNGFFRTIFHEGHWLLATPQNHGYLSVGLNHFHSAYWATRYNATHWQEEWGVPPRGSTEWSDAFYNHVKEVSDMVDANSLGYHSADNVLTRQGRPPLFPYYAHFQPAQISNWRRPGPEDYPDVFSEAFADHCALEATTEVLPWADDDMIIGWVLADIPRITERHALDANGSTWAMLLRNLPEGAAGKQAYMEFIQDHYSNDFEAFDQVYQVTPQIDSWQELRVAVDWRPRSFRNNSAEISDQNDFNRICIEKYYEVVKAAIRGAGANQLFIGDKIQANIGYPDELQLMVEAASKHVEVLMYQYYGDNIQVPNEQSDLQDAIASWTIDALERPNGLPIMNGDGGFGFDNDDNMDVPQRPTADNHEQRGEWFYTYAKNAFENEHTVGWHVCGVIDSWNDSGTDKPGIMNPFGVLHTPEIEALQDISRDLYSFKGFEF